MPKYSTKRLKIIRRVEVLHSLHCLNAIRKELYRDYYDENDKHSFPQEVRRIHVGMRLQKPRNEPNANVSIARTLL